MINDEGGISGVRGSRRAERSRGPTPHEELSFLRPALFRTLARRASEGQLELLHSWQITRATVQFTLKGLFVAVTVCALEAALVAAMSTSPWAALPAAIVAYYVIAGAVGMIVIWWRESRLVSSAEAIAMATLVAPYFVIAMVFLAACVAILG